MMIVLLIAGIGSVLAGLLAITFGIPIKEFGFGNTLILVGVIAVCTGMILLGLWLVVRELKIIAQRLRPVESRARTPLSSVLPSAVGPANAGDDEFPFGRDRAVDAGQPKPGSFPPVSPPPWHEQAASGERVRTDAPSAPEGGPEPAPGPKPRRNLLFSSTSRRERQRAETRATEANASAPVVAPPATESAETSPATFDDAWPKSERARGGEVPPQRRTGRATPTIPEGNVNAPEQPPVTVLKSGVVDGMAYSLYSDGSIEAQMPEGMMRFASIEELRAHLDHRA
jgi:hypothetical protein